MKKQSAPTLKKSFFYLVFMFFLNSFVLFAMNPSDSTEKTPPLRKLRREPRSPKTDDIDLEKKTPPLRKLSRETSSSKGDAIDLSETTVPPLPRKLSSPRGRTHHLGDSSSRSRTVSKEKDEKPWGDSQEEKFTRRKSGISQLRISYRRTPTNSSDESDMHPPSSPIVIEDGDAETPLGLGFPIKQGNNEERAYMEGVSSLLKSDKSPSEIVKILIYSYPAFTNEKYFFNKLKYFKNSHSKIIVEFLNQLAIERFPNGINNLLSAEEELNELKKGLGDFPGLDNFSQNEPSDKNTKNLSCHEKLKKSQNITGENLDIGNFAKALLYRDKVLFSRIPLHGIQNPAFKKEFENHSTQTARWIALQVLIAPTLKEREKLLGKFGCLFRFLLKKQNFHGAMQIAVGLNMQTVTRLSEENKVTPPKPTIEDFKQKEIAEEKKTLRKLTKDPLIQKDEPQRNIICTALKMEPLHKMASEKFESKVSFIEPKIDPLIQKEEDENWLMLSNFIKPKNNFSAYREWLSSALRTPIENSNYLPIFSLIELDELRGKESLKLAITAQEKMLAQEKIVAKEKVSALQLIAEALITFSKHRTIPYPDINIEYLKLVSNFGVHLETLEVFSDLRKSWTILDDRDTKKLIPLDEWTPWYLASFLRQRGWLFKKSKKVEELFTSGIHDGKHIISHMGTVHLDIDEGKHIMHYMEPIRLNIQEDKHIIYYMRTGEIKAQMKKLKQLGLNEKMVQDIIEAYGLQLIANMKEQEKLNWELIEKWSKK